MPLDIPSASKELLRTRIPTDPEPGLRLVAKRTEGFLVSVGPWETGVLYGAHGCGTSPPRTQQSMDIQFRDTEDLVPFTILDITWTMDEWMGIYHGWTDGF